MEAMKKKDRDELMDEIFTAIYEFTGMQNARSTTDFLMKKIDKYVENAVIKARLEVMKNFGAI